MTGESLFSSCHGVLSVDAYGLGKLYPTMGKLLEEGPESGCVLGSGRLPQKGKSMACHCGPTSHSLRGVLPICRTINGGEPT